MDLTASPEPLPQAQPGLAPPSSPTDALATSLTGGIPGLLGSVLQYLLEGKMGGWALGIMMNKTKPLPHSLPQHKETITD